MKFSTAASIAALALASGLGLPDVAQAQVPGPGAQGQPGQNGAVDGQIQTQEPDMVLVSNLWNASVYGQDDSRIGDINDIIIKSDGKIEGVVVGVGGFLGLGEKNVALKLERFKVMRDEDGRPRIMVTAKKEELQQAPEFRTKQDQGSQKGKSDGTQPKTQ